ncbi:MAG: PKD domain-containing protein, partial [Bacteroidota bacterium]
MKKVVFLLPLLFLGLMVHSQEIPINTEDFVTACGGALLDTGANPGPYGNNESHSITICPEDGTVTNLYSPFFDLGTGDQIVIYDGDDNTAPILGTFVENDLQNQSVVATDGNPTGCLTVEFTSDGEDVGNFAFVIDCGPPCDRPISVITTDQGVPHRICPGETVDFSAMDTEVADGFEITTWTWNFDDGSGFVDGGEAISHTYDEPGIYFVNVNVEDNNECTNGNRADFRVEVSNDPEWLSDGGNFSLCLGEEVELTNGPIPVTYVDAPGVNLGGDLFIPDDQTECFSSEIIFAAFEPDAIVDEVSDLESFFINFEHSYMGDLVITFICPNNQTIAVHQQGGGGTYLGEPVDDGSDTPGVGFDYFWAPDATNGTWAEESGGTLPSGTYSSVDSWENLIGCPLNGTWSVEICDLFAIDNGFIFDWTVNIAPENYPEAASFTPTFGADCDSTAWTDGPFITGTSDDCNTINVLADEEGTFQ